MRQVLLAVALLVAMGAGTASAQTNTPRAHPGAGGPRSDLAADAAIRQLYAEFTAAWNAHDPQKMASYWTLDGDIVEPDGMTAKGRSEVEKHFATEQEAAFKDSTLKLAVESVWFPSAEVAMVDGSYMVLNALDPNGQPLPPRKGLVSAVLLKEDGTWRVAASRSSIPVPLPWRPR
ncbi:MAG: SgcJ/EcaC family oxidoreductase [Deltaproteobacteria bacterium]|nr:SgcJ/EcaC family oxidoreductase [Deltaproteobacteria bacterium]